VPISVGYQSGSHYATIQALEAYMTKGEITLSFAEGMLFHRLAALLEDRAPTVSLFSGPYYLAEQLGFRKIIDTTFMIAAMINGDPDPDDVRKYFAALRRAQRDMICGRNSLPATTHVNFRNATTRKWTRAGGVLGSASSLHPTPRRCSRPRLWIARHEIFDSQEMGTGRNEQAVISLSG
jgi:hypothetical protein